MSQEIINELEQQLKDVQKVVNLGKALERLESNRDFQAIILNGYFEKEAIRLVSLKAHANMQTPEYQGKIIRDIDAIGSLLQYFQVLRQQAAIAAKQVNDIEEARDELLTEDAE